jgi:hypothetical protein
MNQGVVVTRILVFFFTVMLAAIACAQKSDQELFLKSKFLAEALAKHDKRTFRSVFRARLGDEKSLEIANTLADSLSRHQGSLGTNKVLKSYAISNSSWMLGQVLFKETTLFYEIRAIDGVVYDLEVGSGPEVFKSTLFSDGFTEIETTSDLVEKAFEQSDTLRDLYKNLFESSNLADENEWPDGSENIKLNSLKHVTSFEVGYRYARHMYLVEANPDIYITCDIDIYRKERGDELVNGYSCGDLIKR